MIGPACLRVINITTTLYISQFFYLQILLNHIQLTSLSRQSFDSWLSQVSNANIWKEWRIFRPRFCTEFQESVCEGLFTVNRVRFGAKTKLYDSASPSLNIMSYWYTWCSNAPSLENLLWSHLFIVSVAQS